MKREKMDLTWKWNKISKLREYEFKDPDFESLISCAFAHSLTCTGNIQVNMEHVSPMIKCRLWSRKHASKTISRKRPSISLIQNNNLDFIWPLRLLMEISQEMFWRWCSNFKMGTLALAMNCNLRHLPVRHYWFYIINVGHLGENEQWSIVSKK